MSNLPIETDVLHNQDYNSEPVYYCRNCLSLKIMSIPGLEDAEFCDECNSTDIGKCSIEEWRKLWKDKHGFDYLERDY